MTYLLCHGFGFCDDYWNNIIPYLDCEYEFYNEDFTVDPDNDYIGIGHSLGFLKLNNSGIKFKALIGLQGFLNFCGEEVTRKQRLEKTLDRMIDQCLADHNRFLKFFYNLCGYPLEPNLSKIDKHQLISDLNTMRYKYEHCGTRTLIIGSEQDRVVEHSILLDNFDDNENVQLKYISQVNHTLGFSKASDVFELIKNFTI